MRVLDNLVLLIGRLCMAALFLPSGLAKARDIPGFAASLAEKGLPSADLLAYATVAVETVGPVLLILGVMPRVTAILLAGFVAIATLTSHLFWLAPEAAQQAQQIHFFKNVAIIGGLAFYFAAGPGRLAIDGSADE